MDLEEFDFWLGEARKRHLRQKLETMENIRFAMWSEAKDFDAVTHSIELGLMTPEQRKRLQDAAWRSLKKVGRA